MEVKDILFGTIGGLGLFLFGMGLLSEGLKKAAGDKMKRLLAMVTRWRLLAFGVGAGVTCLIQSSSATSVLVIGLINAGLLSLKQAICVVMGANVGTTMTAWLVAGMSVFKITSYALPAIMIGLLMNMLGRRQGIKYLGQIILGFGILFIGIHFMKEAFAPLKEDPGALKFLVTVGGNPLLAVLVGAVFTMLVQSSSAAIVVFQMLAMGGAFGGTCSESLPIVIPFILGDNIGTTITAQIAALRSNPAGKRVAMAHTLFNVLGVTLMLPLLYTGWYAAFIETIAPFGQNVTNMGVLIAVSHSAFNIANSIVFLPLVGVLERVVLKIIPIRPSELEMRPVVLEEHLLDTPSLALAQAHREMVRMIGTARDAVEDAIAAVCNDDRARVRDVQKKEDALDDFQSEITRYLVKLSQRDLSPRMANELPVLLHGVNDLERVGDHAVNIAELAERKIDGREAFSAGGSQEIAQICDEVRGMLAETLTALDKQDVAAAGRVLVHEHAVNLMQVRFRANHLHRLSERQCSPIAGLLFVDFVDNMEKIGDHLTNIAEGVSGGQQWIDESHEEDTDPQSEPVADDQAK